LEILLKFLNEKPDEITVELLKMIIMDIAESTEEIVSLETFSKFLEWFGPLDAQMLERMSKIASCTWFHGQLTHIQAEKLIQKKSEAKKGTYLIRFSSKNRGYFTITVVGRKRSLLHYRVFYNRANFEYLMGKKSFKCLHEILTTYETELYLKRACPGSKYYDVILRSIFATE